MKKCSSCGTENADDAVFCAMCGATLSSDSVEAQSPVQEQSTEVVSNAEKDQGAEKPAAKGFKGKVASVVAYEKKHNLIVNAIVAVCALVVALVALLAPIKTVQYVGVFEYNTIIEEYEGRTDDTVDGGPKVTYVYTEVNQSIWQMIGALGYIKADEKDLAELQKQYVAVLAKAQIAFAAWMRDNPKEANDEQAAMSALAEILADNLSDMNYLGYVMATRGKIAGSESGSEGGMDISGEYYSALISMAIGLVVTLLAIIMAIISLVYLIKAIIGIVKKQPQKGLFKYLGQMLGLSCSALCAIFAAPMFKAGGGMFAVALFVAIAYVVCGVVGGLIVGKDSVALIVKRSVVAVAAMVAFFILCTNILNVASGAIAVNAPLGYALQRPLSFIDVMTGGNANEAMMAQLIYSAVGIIFYIILAAFAVSFAQKALRRSVSSLAIDGKSKSPNGSMISAAVFMLIAIIIGLSLTDTIAKQLMNLFDGKPGNVQVKWTMRAQIWVSMILLLVAAIFNMAFRPKNKEVAQAPAEEGKTEVAESSAEETPEQTVTAE
ncbi:MAG: zinc ribbon domain-containing protein [Clostridiales bacterium]|nr:zinc ribbon domain-containing protein [Clostridiales bacterium]